MWVSVCSSVPMLGAYGGEGDDILPNFTFALQSNYPLVYVRITYVPCTWLRCLCTLAHKCTIIAPCCSQFGRFTTYGHTAIFTVVNVEKKIGVVLLALPVTVASGESLNSSLSVKWKLSH